MGVLDTHTDGWSLFQEQEEQTYVVHFHPHPLGGVAGFALTGGRQDVLSHGGGEVRGRRPSLQEEREVRSGRRNWMW